jgi:hypothetical protein
MLPFRRGGSPRLTLFATLGFEMHILGEKPQESPGFVVQPGITSASHSHPSVSEK